MSIRSRAGFEDFVSALPATSIVHQWGDASVAKVGGKVFALFGLDAEGSGLVFKVTEFTFDMLTEADDIAQAPYFAKRQWVTVSAEADLPEEDLKIYILRSYRTIAASLTRKLQRELGIIPN